MESFEIKNLTFTYPNRQNPALCGINLTVGQGEFVTVCGKSGCGKTTLLRLLKSIAAPFGKVEGEILFEGKPLSMTEQREQTSKIGFVMQSPDNQIVTDKVWHELAFGLEGLGCPTSEIRARVSEMASFFGIQTWFHKKVNELSGGQKQILNLASVMAMQPSVLILDEPTSQLDPIAASEFLRTLEKINREIGTTVILSEHRLEEAFPISNRVVVLDEGRIIADGTPQGVGEILKKEKHSMYAALPAPMRVYGSVENSGDFPVTVREGRCWLEKYAAEEPLNEKLVPKAEPYVQPSDIAVELDNVWFRYEKNLPDVIKGMSLKIGRSELFAIMGGNGAGKTTALSLISGLNTPYRGEVRINGRCIKEINGLYNGILGVLPQNPQALFVKKTVYLDLLEMLSEGKLSKAQKDERIKLVSELCRIENLLESHPYDLSGGEQQRAALAKILLLTPEVLLLDEPTKGMDASFKQIFAGILADLKENGVTVIMVSHDIEFCGEYADRCALVFDGEIASEGVPREFFAGKSFYTTSANRMARNCLPSAIIAEDIILACGGSIQKAVQKPNKQAILPGNEAVTSKKQTKKINLLRILTGCVFAVLFILTCAAQWTSIDVLNLSAVEHLAGGTMVQWISIIEISIALACFLPRKELGAVEIQPHRSQRRLNARTLAAMLIALVTVPLTVFVGMFYLQDKKFYFISLLIIIQIMIPFGVAFEGRKPRARELVLISVLCAVAVAGRAAFLMLPQFKPMVAVVIIAGVCFGGETGFLTGVVAAFVSNFFFGQGSWTPWQMVACGLVGFLGGILFQKGWLRKTRASLSVYGFLATFVLYGGIVDSQFILLMLSEMTGEMIVSSYLMGIPFNLIHAASTAFFLWFISEPMVDKLERVKLKYGVIKGD